MGASIPVYQLSSLAEPRAEPAAVFFLGPDSAPSALPIHQPYRSSYYKIGLVLRGRARLQVDLETYDLEPGSLMLLSPYVIKQWPYFSADFEGLSIFFTREFISAGSSLNPDAFDFFARDARHVFPLAPAQAESIGDVFHNIGEKYAAPHAYREEILRSLIHILLHEIAPVYSTGQVAARVGQTRSQLIAAGFKQLAGRHYATERSLAFYADKLCITPKHLAETVREATGKRAVAWLAEAVLLEARLLLQNPALTIAQVAEVLHFADQSTFGRFFRSHAGVSPAAYRQQL